MNGVIFSQMLGLNFKTKGLKAYLTKPPTLVLVVRD